MSTASRDFSFHGFADHRHLHSFPTRRSSDLVTLETARSEVFQVLGTEGSEASDTTPLVPPPVPYTPDARASLQLALQEARGLRSEERRVGKEWRSRWWLYQ